MRNASSNDESSLGSEEVSKPRTQGGSQTLLRGLDVIEAVADGPLLLAELSQRLGLTRSTTHRLAAALIERRYLSFTPRLGYQFGPKLLELGFLAQAQTDLVQVARPHLEQLALDTGDTVHLGLQDGDGALYLDKIPGRRRVEISSRIGDRQPLTATGLGKALLIDTARPEWRRLFDIDRANGSPPANYADWEGRMTGYAAGGYAFDLEENEDLIRCVAAPIRGPGSGIVAAISVSSAAQYMTTERMAALIAEVRGCADAISADLGGPAPAGRSAKG